MILSHCTDKHVLLSSDSGSKGTTGKGVRNKEAADVTACNKGAHSAVTGGVVVSTVKSTKSEETSRHEDPGIEVACRHEAEDPLRTAVTDSNGNNAHEIELLKHRKLQPPTTT